MRALDHKEAHSSRHSPPRARIACCIPDGCTDAIMIAHGFTIEQMVELVRAGLASATAERIGKSPENPL